MYARTIKGSEGGGCSFTSYEYLYIKGAVRLCIYMYICIHTHTHVG